MVASTSNHHDLRPDQNQSAPPGNGVQTGQVSEVAKMFDGRSVFITGASGFVGRVLLEKLLRCYAGIKRVYILMRTKKEEPPEVRLHKRVLNVPLFDKIRSMQHFDGANLFNKIVMIPGDIGEQQLGISDVHMQMLLDDERLSIVFHSAVQSASTSR